MKNVEKHEKRTAKPLYIGNSILQTIYLVSEKLK